MRFWRIEIRVSVRDPQLDEIDAMLSPILDLEGARGSAGVDALIELHRRASDSGARWFERSVTQENEIHRLKWIIKDLRRVIDLAPPRQDDPLRTVDAGSPIGDAVCRKLGVDLDVTTRSSVVTTTHDHP